MRDWIVGLQKAANEVRGGATASDWENASRELGRDAPEELRELYAHINGARFASGVMLFPLESTGEVRGVIELSHAGTAGLPNEDVWLFGERDGEQLAAVRKRRLGEIAQGEVAPLPDWLGASPEESWVFIARDPGSNGLALYPSLEQMLTIRVPPAEAEDFGDRTYARALMLVEGALTELGASSNPKAVKRVAAVVGTASPKARPLAARTATKRSAAKKTPAKKAAAAKKKPAATRKPAPKKPAAKKPAVKKPAARKAPARKSSARKVATKRPESKKPVRTAARRKKK